MACLKEEIKVLRGKVSELLAKVDGSERTKANGYKQQATSSKGNVNKEVLPEVLYDHLRGSRLWRNKLEHGSTNRFFGVVARGKQELEFWTIRLYGNICFLIEKNSLPAASKSLNLKLVKPGPANRSTAKQREAAQAVKTCTKNVAELVYLMYSDVDNKRLQRIIAKSTASLMEWRTCHNLASRSGAGTLEWAMAQCSGGYLLHRSRLAHSSRVYLVLADIGFDADTTGLDDKAARSATVYSQDRLAACAGTMVVGLLGSRLRHGAQYLAGWPTRSVLLASTDVRIRTKAALSMKRAWATFRLMQKTTARHEAVGAFVRRSAWQTTPCAQLVRMLSLDEWKATPRIQQHCKDNNSTLWADQVCEDGINYSKASGRQAATKLVAPAAPPLAATTDGPGRRIANGGDPGKDLPARPGGWLAGAPLNRQHALSRAALAGAGTPGRASHGRAAVSGRLQVGAPCKLQLHVDAVPLLRPQDTRAGSLEQVLRRQVDVPRWCPLAGTPSTGGPRSHGK